MIEGVAKRLESFDESRATEALADPSLMLDMVHEFFLLRIIPEGDISP